MMGRPMAGRAASDVVIGRHHAETLIGGHRLGMTVVAKKAAPKASTGGHRAHRRDADRHHPHSDSTRVRQKPATATAMARVQSDGQAIKMPRHTGNARRRAVIELHSAMVVRHRLGGAKACTRESLLSTPNETKSPPVSRR